MSKLQEKKNLVRLELFKKGILKRGGENAFDKYSYFSEAQYKQLFVELFSTNGLEFSMTTVSVEEFHGTDKMPFGRRVNVEYSLIDKETGETERSLVLGEALDKGDKALYKAYTGSLKYYFANTWHVPTGDEPENENDKQEAPEHIQKFQVEIIKKVYNEEALATLLAKNNLNSLDEMSYIKATALIDTLRQKSKG